MNLIAPNAMIARIKWPNQDLQMPYRFESKLLPAVLLLLKIYFPKITVTVTVLKFGWITITVTVLAPVVTPSFPLTPNYRLESHVN